MTQGSGASWLFDSNFFDEWYAIRPDMVNYVLFKDADCFSSYYSNCGSIVLVMLDAAFGKQHRALCQPDFGEDHRRVCQLVARRIIRIINEKNVSQIVDVLTVCPYLLCHIPPLVMLPFASNISYWTFANTFGDILSTDHPYFVSNMCFLEWTVVLQALRPHARRFLGSNFETAKKKRNTFRKIALEQALAPFLPRDVIIFCIVPYDVVV